MSILDIKELEEKSRSARWRHASWSVNRRRVYDAMIATHRPDNRINSFAACGCNAQVMEADNDGPRDAKGERVVKLVATYCHDRLCIPCGNARAAEIARCLQQRIEGKKLKFITLTIAGAKEGLASKVDRLYKGFRALRVLPLWKERIAGGAAFLEIKWSDKSQRWHPHFHLICEGKFIDQGELSDAWRAITRDSFIVDVRAVKDPDEVRSYVTKYASKPLNMSFAADPDLLQEALTSLHGRRLCFAFGTWYRTKLHEVDAPDEDRRNFTAIVPLNDLLADAERGIPAAITLLHKLGLTRKWEKYILSTAGP